jgi:hypothetical protein
VARGKLVIKLLTDQGMFFALASPETLRKWKKQGVLEEVIKRKFLQSASQLVSS